MTRSSRVKLEPVDAVDENPLSDTVGMSSPLQPTQQSVTIRSTMSPALDTHISSGSTTLADDTEMTDTQDAGGPSNSAESTQEVVPDAMQTLGQDSRKLIQCIQKLDALGIASTLESLPSFVVVGDQSAGKSSIIEAMCDISLPRSEGTCTRCPFQITTTAAKNGKQQWSCTISLQYRYFYDPHGHPGPSDSHRSWQPRDLDLALFMTIYDKSQLHAALQRAQLALLHPSQPQAIYSNPNDFEVTRNEVSFSPNVVSLEIEAPDLPELSLFDLPGAINVYEDQKQVRFVEDLIKTYVQDEKALVLLACSANADVETSTAFRFVKDCNAIQRCMGVLTKPDLLVRQRLPTIMRILRGEKFKLGSEWFITKQLSQEEVDDSVSYAEARQRERTFFTTSPWTTDLAEFSSRFGVQNIQQTVSRKLTEHILTELPGISARVQIGLAEVMAQLQEFPAKPISAVHTVIDEVHKVEVCITAHVRGESSRCASSEDDFKTKYRKLLHNMRDKLKKLRPQVDLGTPGYEAPTFAVDDEDEMPVETPTPTPSKKRKDNSGQALRTPQGARARTEAPRSRIKTERFQPFTRITFKLDQVKDRFDRGSNSGLPDQVNPKVTATLIKESMSGWISVTTSFTNGLANIIEEMVRRTLGETLSARSQTQLYDQISDTIRTYWTGLLQEQVKLLMHIVDCECHTPITLNPALTLLTETVRAQLKKDRQIARVDEHFDPLAAEGTKVPSKPERAKRLDELEAKLGSDPFRREVDALATPLAYYDLAEARMMDNMAMLLERGLLFPLATELRTVLWTKLRVTEEAHCVMLLAEDPRREEQRIHLLTKKEKLETALAELQALPNRGAA